MPKRLFLPVLIVCALILSFAANAPAARLKNGHFAEAWVEYEKEFNDYMQDYISEKTKGLKYSKKKKLLSKKEYKKQVKAFMSVKKTYAAVQQKSETIRGSLKAIDFIISSDGTTFISAAIFRPRSADRLMAVCVSAKRRASSARLISVSSTAKKHVRLRACTNRFCLPGGKQVAGFHIK